QARCGNCHAASARGGNGRRGGERDRLAASYGSRRLLGNLEEKARADSRFGPRGAWPCLSHHRAGERMKSPTHEASARQRFGEPFSGLSANDARSDRLSNQDLAGVDGEIARLVDRSTQELRRAWRTLYRTSTQELRRAWRTLYRTGPPPGLSRDLIIRGLADKLQQRAYGG